MADYHQPRRRYALRSNVQRSAEHAKTFGDHLVAPGRQIDRASIVATASATSSFPSATTVTARWIRTRCGSLASMAQLADFAADAACFFSWQ